MHEMINELFRIKGSCNRLNIDYGDDDKENNTDHNKIDN
jgi:hypothetical protein